MSKLISDKHIEALLSNWRQISRSHLTALDKTFIAALREIQRTREAIREHHKVHLTSANKTQRALASGDLYRATLPEGEK